MTEIIIALGIAIFGCWALFLGLMLSAAYKNSRGTEGAP